VRPAATLASILFGLSLAVAGDFVTPKTA
jgi:hypothetical protein